MKKLTVALLTVIGALTPGVTSADWRDYDDDGTSYMILDSVSSENRWVEYDNDTKTMWRAAIVDGHHWLAVTWKTADGENDRGGFFLEHEVTVFSQKTWAGRGPDGDVWFAVLMKAERPDREYLILYRTEEDA